MSQAQHKVTIQCVGSFHRGETAHFTLTLCSAPSSPKSVLSQALGSLSPHRDYISQLHTTQKQSHIRRIS